MTKKNENSKLERTYGTFDIRGIVSAIDDVNNGKTSKGNEYKSIKVHVKTDENSEIIVDLFGQKKDEIEIDKFVGKQIERKKIKWSARNTIEEGYVISNMDAIRVGKEVSDIKKKGGLKQIVVYDAIDKISEYFNEGDSINVSGSLSFQPYTNPETKQTTIYPRYTLNKIAKIEEIDFNDEDYEPYAKFEQNVIVSSVEREDKNAQVNCIIVIDKDGNYVNQQFIIKIDKRPNLVKNMRKIKEYSLIPIKGDIINRAIIDDVPTEDDGWGYDNQQKAVKGYERYFEILAADGTKLVEGKYTSEDFIVKDELDEEDEKLEELGSSITVDADSPFENADDGEDLNDDEWL